MKIIRKADQTISNWSGGTTTQLYIYPEHASYRKRNFQFRISTATVDSDESTFTYLPGVSRHLMILEGDLKIEPAGKHTKILNKFETDSFEGDWETKGYGRVTDFNLMTTGKVQGSLTGKSLKKNKFIWFQPNPKVHFLGFYLFKGIVEIKYYKEILNLNEKDFLILNLINSSNEIEIKAVDVSEIAVAEIYSTMNFLE
jgi:uncharacterized protein